MNSCTIPVFPIFFHCRLNSRKNFTMKRYYPLIIPETFICSNSKTLSQRWLKSATLWAKRSDVHYSEQWRDYGQLTESTDPSDNAELALIVGKSIVRVQLQLSRSGH